MARALINIDQIRDSANSYFTLSNYFLDDVTTSF